MPPKRRKGRPSKREKRVKVWLGQSVYDLWKEKKDSLGYGKSTNSKFAELLLKGISISTPQSASSSVRKRTRVETDIDHLSPVATSCSLF